MKRILLSPWSTATIGVAAYCFTTWIALAPAKLLSRPPASVALSPQAAPAPSWNFYSTELDQLLAEVREEKEALKSRAEQLKEFQIRLESERQEICTVTQRVWQMQQQLDKNVVQIKEAEQGNLKKLIKMYAAMTPESATKILREMETEQALKILATMRESESAVVLENMAKNGEESAKHAAMLIDRLRLILTRGPEPKQAQQ